jgi:hypothetical protein
MYYVKIDWKSTNEGCFDMNFRLVSNVDKAKYSMLENPISTISSLDEQTSFIIQVLDWNDFSVDYKEDVEAGKLYFGVQGGFIIAHD